MFHENTKIKKEKVQRSGAQKALHVVGSIFGMLMCVVLLPLLIVNVTIIVKSYISPEELPTFRGVSPLIVLSGSMEETIMTGDMIFVRAVDEGAIKADEKNGDIITYMSENKKFVTHRAVREQTEEDGSKSYVMKGDANEVYDRYAITTDQVVGKYFFRIPKLGALANFMKEPTGMILFIILPLALIVAYEFLRRNLNDRQKKKAAAGLEAELEKMREQLEKGNASNSDN